MGKVLLHELGKSISFGRLSLLGKVLWPMLLAASDNQGRGLAEPDVVKWTVCPNVAELNTGNIPAILEEMTTLGMVCTYRDSRSRLLYQVVRWWEYQQPQWAQPSKFEPPEGWVDRVRANRRDSGMMQENWGAQGGFMGMEEAPVEAGGGRGQNPGANAGGNPGAIVNKDQPSLIESNLVPLTAETGVPNPADLTVREIGALDLSKEQWEVVLQLEKRGKNRRTAVRHIRRALHPRAPCIDVFHRAAGAWPDEAIWDDITAAVGDKPEDLDFWGKVVKAYVRCGWNKFNLDNMLGYFERREIPKTNGRGNIGHGRNNQRPSAPGAPPGKPAAEPVDAAVVAADRALLDERRARGRP